MKGIFKSSIARSIIGDECRHQREMGVAGASAGVKSLRVTIYVARLSETLQEQFITDIRTILGGVKTLL